MKTFEFTIIATGLDPQADDFESRFYDAGCDDALVSFQKGRILVDFCREGESLESAIASAVQACAEAGATVEHIEPDPLVSLSEIASRSDMTRAAISQYAQGNRLDGFPAPKARVTTKSPMWDWSEVSAWLYQQKRLSRESALEATVFSAANDLLNCGPSDFTVQLHRAVEERTEAFALT